MSRKKKKIRKRLLKRFRESLEKYFPEETIRKMNEQIERGEGCFICREVPCRCKPYEPQGCPDCGMFTKNCRCEPEYMGER